MRDKVNRKCSSYSSTNCDTVGCRKMIVALKNHDAQMIEVNHDKAKGKMKMCNENGILKMNTEEIRVLECADNA